jgi:hypothetical protein
LTSLILWGLDFTVFLPSSVRLVIIMYSAIVPSYLC